MDTTGTKTYPTDDTIGVTDTAKTDAPATQAVADAAHTAIDEAARRAEPIEHKVRSTAREASTELEARQEATYEQLQQTLEKTETFVKEKPLFAAGAAFAAGVLATTLLRR